MVTDNFQIMFLFVYNVWLYYGLLEEQRQFQQLYAQTTMQTDRAKA